MCCMLPALNGLTEETLSQAVWRAEDCEVERSAGAKRKAQKSRSHPVFVPCLCDMFAHICVGRCLLFDMLDWVGWVVLRCLRILRNSENLSSDRTQSQQCSRLHFRLKLQARNVKMGMRVAALGFPLGPELTDWKLRTHPPTPESPGSQWLKLSEGVVSGAEVQHLQGEKLLSALGLLRVRLSKTTWYTRALHPSALATVEVRVLSLMFEAAERMMIDVVWCYYLPQARCLCSAQMPSCGLPRTRSGCRPREVSVVNVFSMCRVDPSPSWIRWWGWTLLHPPLSQLRIWTMLPEAEKSIEISMVLHGMSKLILQWQCSPSCGKFRWPLCWVMQTVLRFPPFA